MSIAKKNTPRTAQKIYALLLEKGIEVDSISDERFKLDFKHEKMLQHFAHGPEEGQRVKPSIVFLTGRNLAEKIETLQSADDMTFISIRQIFRAILKESENPSENKVVIGYPVTRLNGTFNGRYVYKVSAGKESLSFLSDNETDKLIARHGAGNVHAFVIKIFEKRKVK